MSRRVYVRKFDWDEARARHGAGESITEIARRMGVTWSAVQRAVVPGKREAQAVYSRERQKLGRCDDCGGSMNLLSRYQGSTRCVACAAFARGTSAREAELQCATCREWKPEDAFPSNRSEKYVRRGRHHQCTACGTDARRDYRRRNREQQNAYDRAYRARRRAQARAEDLAKPKKGADQSAA